MILREFRLETRAELIPIGFGLLVITVVMARSTLRDYLRGYLLMYDYVMDAGEEVTVAGRTGVVQELSLRETRLMLPDGETAVIPNGLIGVVVNHSRRTKAAPAATPPE